MHPIITTLPQSPLNQPFRQPQGSTQEQLAEMTTPEKYNKYKEISRVNVNKIVTLGMAFRDIGTLLCHSVALFSLPILCHWYIATYVLLPYTYNNQRQQDRHFRHGLSGHRYVTMPLSCSLLVTYLVSLVYSYICPTTLYL